jgi:hypothetical protein
MGRLTGCAVAACVLIGCAESEPESQVSQALLTQVVNISTRPEFPNRSAKTYYSASLAMGSYQSDLHGCNATPTLDLGDTSSMASAYGRPYQVPLGAFVAPAPPPGSTT